mmetsp:Transcript_7267/g.25759  ORF Transcript_7267/g.25759 Transcript_7267/m.25759 type:complete len:126 (+) Transcript_7267:328-705(+)
MRAFPDAAAPFHGVIEAKRKDNPVAIAFPAQGTSTGPSSLGMRREPSVLQGDMFAPHTELLAAPLQRNSSVMRTDSEETDESSSVCLVDGLQRNSTVVWTCTAFLHGQRQVDKPFVLSELCTQRS